MNLLTRSLVLILSLTLISQPKADEGMYPISEIGRLKLHEKGLQLSPRDIFNPDGIGLINGICRVNGCTGSFVSPNGLIITNHHCAYRAINAASTADKDYLRNGFQAKTLGEEIPATGYTVRITESYRDVSKQVLDAVDPDSSYLQRTKAITKRRKEIEQQAEQDSPGKRAEVAEMFVGKSYVLFLYTYIKDVRLVFAPPSSIGNFGGDIDNWEWPRHTGDFSFMRAYVAPDGSTADYAKTNVPYRPKRHIQVAKGGAAEGDFVFLLGYPGRTSRHKTARFLEFERDFRLPYVVNLYQWQLEEMQAAAASDRAVALKLLSRMRSLANVEKRSRGQLKGLARKRIVETRQVAEAKLQAYIDNDPLRKEKYGRLLSEIAAVYADQQETAEFESDFQNLRSACRTFSVAFTLYDAASERSKADLERESAYMDRNFDLTVSRMMSTQKDVHVETDKQLLLGMLKRLADHDEAGDVEPLGDWFSTPVKLEKRVDELFAHSKLTDAVTLKQLLAKDTAQLEQTDDSMLQFLISLYPAYKALREMDKERAGKLNALYGDLIEIKKEYLSSDFVPDANATLRMTFGQVKSYSPEDGVLHTPFTTLSGVIDKTTGKTPFETPTRVVDMHKTKSYGGFAHPKLNDVPVALLYDTDTTGGNSGSPILNGKGQLVGVNFDRAFEATINDFAWHESYSRSIGVDVRYALWITGPVYGANHLLKEMGVD